MQFIQDIHTFENSMVNAENSLVLPYVVEMGPEDSGLIHSDSIIIPFWILIA